MTNVQYKANASSDVFCITSGKVYMEFDGEVLDDNFHPMDRDVLNILITGGYMEECN